MNNKIKNNLSRRQFLGYSALGLTGLTILPSWVTAGVKVSPSDRVVLGFIGAGRQALSDFRGFQGCPGVQVAAVSDVDSIKVQRFQIRVKEWQKQKGMNERCDGYEFYEDLLNRKDIDAIEVVTPEHWHALPVIHGAQAGKDIYCQKPLSYTITEALDMVRAVRDNKRVLQVGSQQRSDPEFQKAIEIVRTGKIGYIEKVFVRIGAPPDPFNLEEHPVPSNLNFNQWLGPLNDPKVHYHPQMCPVVSVTPPAKAGDRWTIQNETGPWAVWRYYRETGNGYTADWGAHHYDIMQAALGMDGSAPVEYIPKGVNGAQYNTMKYANGIVVTSQGFLDDNDQEMGIKFWGTKGWVEVARGYLGCSDPSLVPADVPQRRPMNAAQRQAMQQQQNTAQRQQTQQQDAARALAQEISAPHMQNFIDCVRSRQNPIAPVEVGCSSNIVCLLQNISVEENRVIRWDPATLSFVNDKAAYNHRLYGYKYRNGYSYTV